MSLECVPTKELTPALEQELETFLDTQDTSHPFQFPQWGDPTSKVFFLRKNDQICWAGTFGLHPPLGHKLPWIRAAVAVRGPVCDDLELWQEGICQIVELLKAESICYVEVSPDWLRHSGSDPGNWSQDWRPMVSERYSLRLDLTSDEDALFGKFRKNSRYEVRHAERIGATVHEASTDEDIGAFLRLYQDLAKRKGFAQDELARMRRQIRWLIASGSRGALLLASAQDSICGGTVIARAARRCWYVWGATSRAINIGHLLQWRALQWARRNGCTEYDFGGYTPGATSGPAWFKAGFGGTQVQFTQPSRLILQPGRYRILSLLSQ